LVAWASKKLTFALNTGFTTDSRPRRDINLYDLKLTMGQ
jgi:hypothetical protein